MKIHLFANPVYIKQVVKVNLQKRPHRRRTWTVQWYLPGDASVHPT